MIDAKLTEIVTGAIEATVHPVKWNATCDRIVNLFDATAFVMFEFNFQDFSGPHMHVSKELGSAGRHLIERTLTEMPPEEIDVFKRFSLQKRGELIPEASIYNVDHDLKMPANPFRDEVLAAVGSKSRNACRMNDIGPWADVAALHLPVYGVDIPAETREQMNLLFKVFGTCLETGRVVRNLTLSFGGLLDAFDQLAFGAVICEADGRILVSNAHFRDMARDGDAFTEAASFIQESSGGLSTRIGQLIRNAQFVQSDSNALITSLPKRSGGRPLVAKAAPLRDQEFGAQNLSLVLIVDPADDKRLSADGLASFGLLTDAEQDVCNLLVKGFDTNEIAEHRDTTITTTRGQIKSLSSKLSCNSRLELVRLAMSSHVPLKDGET